MHFRTSRFLAVTLTSLIAGFGSTVHAEEAPPLPALLEQARQDEHREAVAQRAWERFWAGERGLLNEPVLPQELIEPLPVNWAHQSLI